MHKQIELFPKEFDPIEEYAKLGTGVSGGKERIKDFFEHNKNLPERIDFLKKEYGFGVMQTLKDISLYIATKI